MGVQNGAAGAGALFHQDVDIVLIDVRVDRGEELTGLSSRYGVAMLILGARLDLQVAAGIGADAYPGIASGERDRVHSVRKDAAVQGENAFVQRGITGTGNRGIPETVTVGVADPRRFILRQGIGIQILGDIELHPVVAVEHIAQTVSLAVVRIVVPAADGNDVADAQSQRVVFGVLAEQIVVAQRSRGVGGIAVVLHLSIDEREIVGIARTQLNQGVLVGDFRIADLPAAFQFFKADDAVSAGRHRLSGRLPVPVRQPGALYDRPAVEADRDAAHLFDKAAVGVLPGVKFELGAGDLDVGGVVDGQGLRVAAVVLINGLTGLQHEGLAVGHQVVRVFLGAGERTFLDGVPDLLAVFVIDRNTGEGHGVDQRTAGAGDRGASGLGVGAIRVLDLDGEAGLGRGLDVHQLDHLDAARVGDVVEGEGDVLLVRYLALDEGLSGGGIPDVGRARILLLIHGAGALRVGVEIVGRRLGFGEVVAVVSLRQRDGQVFPAGGVGGGDLHRLLRADGIGHIRSGRRVLDVDLELRPAHRRSPGGRAALVDRDLGIRLVGDDVLFRRSVGIGRREPGQVDHATVGRSRRIAVARCLHKAVVGRHGLLVVVHLSRLQPLVRCIPQRLVVVRNDGQGNILQFIPVHILCDLGAGSVGVDGDRDAGDVGFTGAGVFLCKLDRERIAIVPLHGRPSRALELREIEAQIARRSAGLGSGSVFGQPPHKAFRGICLLDEVLDLRPVVIELQFVPRDVGGADRLGIAHRHQLSLRWRAGPFVGIDLEFCSISAVAYVGETAVGIYVIIVFADQETDELAVVHMYHRIGAARSQRHRIGGGGVDARLVRNVIQIRVGIRGLADRLHEAVFVGGVAFRRGDLNAECTVGQSDGDRLVVDVLGSLPVALARVFLVGALQHESEVGSIRGGRQRPAVRDGSLCRADVLVQFDGRLRLGVGIGLPHRRSRFADFDGGGELAVN